jgi:hypothetical protein
MHFRLAVSAAAKVREAKSASRALSVSVLNDKSTAKSTETTASTHPAAASATLSFDLMMPALSTYRRSRN